MIARPAQYSASTVPSFCKGNPLSEALPELPNDKALFEELLIAPKGDFSIARTNDPNSFYEASTLLEINLPRLETPILMRRIYSMIHNAYSKSNPMTSQFIGDINSIDSDLFSEKETLDLQSDAMTILGWSGVGKSTLIRSILKFFPQLTKHSEYKNRPLTLLQVVWLSVDAPLNGSPKGFLNNIARALDKVLQLRGKQSYFNQMESSSAETMKVHLARALRTHCVGLLHVDDIQRWGEGDRKARLLSMSMLIGLANTIGCSLLLSGTPAAVEVLKTSFESSRRANRRPHIVIKTPTNYEDPFFESLINYLFSFQLSTPWVAVNEDFRKTIFQLTAGIPGVITSLYVAVIEEALLSRQPLSVNLFKVVMQESFSMLTDPIENLRKGRAKNPDYWDPDTDKKLSRSVKKKSLDDDA